MRVITPEQLQVLQTAEDFVREYFAEPDRGCPEEFHAKVSRLRDALRAAGYGSVQ